MCGRKRYYRCTVIAIVACAVTYICLFNIFAIYGLAKSSNYSRSWMNRKGHMFITHPELRYFACNRVGYSKTPLPSTALVSFPGSGNTWVRHIIQEATGIPTGSVYVDIGLKRGGFPGEGVTNSSVIVIKTHDHGHLERQKYQKAIMVIRDPYDAILAEFNRRYGGHKGHAIKAHFDREWYSFVFEMSREWFDFYHDWLTFKGPLHIILYKNLKSNPQAETQSLLDFLNVTIPYKAFLCVMRNFDGRFRRPYMGQTKKELYNSYMRHTIDFYVNRLSIELGHFLNKSEIKIS